MEQLKVFLTDTVASACKNIVVALLILFIGLWLVGILSRALKKGKLLKKLDSTVRNYLQHAISIVLRIVVILSAAAYVGVPMASVVALLGSAGLAIGLALQGGLSNIAGGLIILVTRPFKKGDYVTIDDISGTVDSIGIYYTTLITPDCQRVVIPNGTVTAAVITDYSDQKVRRLDLDFSIAYGEDIDKVKDILARVASENDKILKDPAFEVFVAEHDQSAVIYKLRVWTIPDDHWPVKFGLTEAVKKALDRENVEIPFPQMDVHIKQ